MTTTALKHQSAFRHPTVSSALAGTWSTMCRWRERARQRTDLAQMSAEMLEDIGISTSAARAEASKPFWRA